MSAYLPAKWFHNSTEPHSYVVLQYCLNLIGFSVVIRLRFKTVMPWGLKKKMFVCLFLTDPKFWKTWVAFFFLLIFNFAFLNKIVKIKVSKYIVTVPKIYCVGREGIYVYPIHVSTRLFDVTYLNTDNYMHFSNIQIKKKKWSTYRPSQFSGQKSKQTFIFLGLIWKTWLLWIMMQ